VFDRELVQASHVGLTLENKAEGQYREVTAVHGMISLATCCLPCAVMMMD
jgi:hypothetical protein